MSSELDRLARMVKMRTEEERTTRQEVDFSRRKANVEAAKRYKQAMKRHRKAA